MESYNLVISSGNTNINTSNKIAGTTTSNLTYFFNFNETLPLEKYSTYILTWSFLSSMISPTSNYTDAILLNVNFGSAS